MVSTLEPGEAYPVESRLCPCCRKHWLSGKKPGETYRPALPDGWKACPQCGKSGLETVLFKGKRKAIVGHCIHRQEYFESIRKI